MKVPPILKVTIDCPVSRTEPVLIPAKERRCPDEEGPYNTKVSVYNSDAPGLIETIYSHLFG